MGAWLLQRVLDEILNPFQPGFSQGTETALAAAWREQDGCNATLLGLLDLSVAFDAVDQGILRGWLWGLELGAGWQSPVLLCLLSPINVDREREVQSTVGCVGGWNSGPMPLLSAHSQLRSLSPSLWLDPHLILISSLQVHFPASSGTSLWEASAAFEKPASQERTFVSQDEPG